MPDKDLVDQSPKPPNPNNIKSKRGKALSNLVAYSFSADTSTIGHIEYSTKRGDKKLIRFGGKEVIVHSPRQS